MKKPKLMVDLMLDSGAFSAWNQAQKTKKPVELRLEDYIQYLKDWKEYIFSYVTMDVLAAGKEKLRTPAAIEEAAQASYRNHQIMKEHGLSPIPVYHQGENIKHLERYLDDGETYIGVSSRKDLWAEEQRNFLDTAFSVITDSQGRALCKAHGFGITRPAFLFRYPFYSVDSTTWTLTPGYGSVLIPVENARTKEWDYSKAPERVIMSGKEHVSTTNQKKRFEAEKDSVHRRAHIVRWLEEVAGIDIYEARYSPIHRRKAVLIYYLKVMENMRGIRFTDKVSRLGPSHVKDRKPMDIQGRIMFATNLNREWALLMNDLGVRTRLLSYFDMRELPPDTLKEYVTKGFLGEWTGRRTPKRKWTDEVYRNYRAVHAASRANAENEDHLRSHAHDLVSSTIAKQS